MSATPDRSKSMRPGSLRVVDDIPFGPLVARFPPGSSILILTRPYGELRCVKVLSPVGVVRVPEKDVYIFSTPV